MKPEELTVALVNAINLTSFLQISIRHAAETENTMTSTERILEYTELPKEPLRCLISLNKYLIIKIE